MLYKNCEWLNAQYTTNKLSAIDIAKMCGCNPSTIYAYLKRFSIPVRSICESGALASSKLSTITSVAMKAKWQDATYREHMLSVRRGRDVNIYRSDGFRKKISGIVSNRWDDPASRRQGECHLDNIRKLSSTNMIEALRKPDARDGARSRSLSLWGDPEFKRRMLDLFDSSEYKSHHLQAVNTDEYREMQSTLSKARWQNQEFKNKMLEIIRSEGYRLRQAAIRAEMPRVSSLQLTLYSILDDLNIGYFKEHKDAPCDDQCVVGPYVFDCVVPRPGRPTLLIECQGDYWHSLAAASRNDKAKASYIANNFSGQYELKYIWEHEFKTLDKVNETLKYWLGIRDCTIEGFSFSDIAIKLCPPVDYRSLLSKYHYLPNAGRGGIAYGAYLGEKLVAVCIFSPLPRQNISIGDYVSSEVRELSRLCIHPSYGRDNLASWFISRCIKLLPNKYKSIITYCDTTFNHNGAAYKACNFVHDKVVQPDYWYVSPDGWVMHKKTLYNHAVKLHATEAEYAKTIGYTKVFGMEKLRFIYNR